MPSSRKWWMWNAWCVPIHGSMRWSNTPTHLAFGCVWSPRPICRARTRLRFKMPGVWRAPAARTTSFARTVNVPAERRRALQEEVRVLAERVLVVRLDVQDALGLGEVPLHGGGPGRVEAEIALPLLEHARRRAPRHAAVDDGRAADATALGEDDGRPAEDHGGAGVAVETAKRRHGLGRERVDAMERALFEHE